MEVQDASGGGGSTCSGKTAEIWALGSFPSSPASPLPWSRLGAWSPAAAVGGLAVLTGFEGAGSGEEEIAFQMCLPLLNWNGQV